MDRPYVFQLNLPSRPTGDVQRDIVYLFEAIHNLAAILSGPSGFAAPTGTASLATFDTATVTTAQLAQRVKALIDYGLANGTL